MSSSDVEVFEPDGARAGPSKLRQRLSIERSDVLELSDGSDDDASFVVTSVKPAAQTSDSDDDLPPAFKPGVMLPSRTASLSALEPIRHLGNSVAPRGVGGPTLTARTQSLNLPRSASEVQNHDPKGKQRAREPLPLSHSMSDDTLDEDEIAYEAMKRNKARKRRAERNGNVSDEGAGQPKKRASRMNNAAKNDRKLLKEQEKAAKEAAKLQEKVDKQARLDANKLRVGDKAATVTELDIHMTGPAFGANLEQGLHWPGDDDELFESAADRQKVVKARKKAVTAWKEIGMLLEARMLDQGCRVTMTAAQAHVLPSESTLTWTRLCDRKWNNDISQFEPLGVGNEILVEEDTRIVFMTALDISLLIATNSFEKRIKAIQKAMPSGAQLFLMHYGLSDLFKQIENAKQASFRAQVRDQLEGDGGADADSRFVGIGTKQPDRAKIEYTLDKAQVMFGFRMTGVDKATDAVDWLEQFSYDVSQKPYQRLKMKHLAMLGIVDDKAPSGKDGPDHMVKMLSTVKSVTESLAQGIVREYPSIRQLYEAWGSCMSDRERKEMLVGISKTRNVDGTASNRAIGKITSENVFKVFNVADPDFLV
ncbi:hypothetical protein OIO90_000583 [Microbotryomycetes sp. JL221]|nr:hypothetical protein OIO90_000583 [Microbotryomycetes sp. JL221]